MRDYTKGTPLDHFRNGFKRVVFGYEIDETKYKHSAVIRYQGIYIHVLQDANDPDNYSVSWQSFIPDGVDLREIIEIGDTDNK